MDSLKVYFLMSADGKFYRSRGQSGRGNVWTDDINKTKIYVRLGQARARQTWWAKNYPDFETPKIMCLEGLPTEVAGEKERASKAVQKIEEEKLKDLKRENIRETKELEKQMSDLNRKLEMLSKK
jgi:hypothetical protein